MAEPDELFTLKNQFWLGNYQKAINEGSVLHLTSDATKIMRDVYVYRAYIASGNCAVVLDEISDAASTPVELRAVKLLATYLSNKDAREVAVLTASQWMDEPESASNPTVQLIVATVLGYEEKHADALRAIKSKANMEQRAFAVQTFLKMNRLDLAEKCVLEMQAEDDESTLCQLSAGWLALAQGGQKRFLEASYVFQEQIDRHGTSVVLLNALGVALMNLGRYEDAEKLFIDASGKNANDPDTLVNLISCAQHTGKPVEFVQRYISQLKRSSPDHPAAQQFDLLDSMFDRVAAQHAV